MKNSIIVVTHFFSKRGDRPNFFSPSLNHLGQLPYRSCGLVVLFQVVAMVSPEQLLQLMQRYRDYVGPVFEVMDYLHGLILGL